MAINRNELSIIIIIASIVLATCSFTDASRNKDDEDKSFLKTFFQGLPGKGLEALYMRSRSFILGITGDGIVNTLAKEIGINLSNPSMSDVVKLKSMRFDLPTLLPKAVRAGTGYIVIVIIGIILTLIFLVSCCFFFCCRKAGCCFGKVEKAPLKKSDSLVVGVLIGFLLLVSLLLALAAYGSSASGLAVSNNLQKDGESKMPLMGSLVGPIQRIFDFIPKIITEINETLDANELSNQLNKFLPDFSAIIREQMDSFNNSCSSCGSLMTILKNISSEANQISESVEKINTTQNELTINYNNLNESISDFKTKTLESINSCGTDACRTLKAAVTNMMELRTLIPFPRFADNFESLKELKKYSIDVFKLGNITNVTEFIGPMITPLINSMKDELKKIPLDSLNFDFFKSEPTTLKILGSVEKHLPAAIKAVAIVVIVTVVIIILLNIFGIVGAVVWKEKATCQKTFLGSTQFIFCVAPILCIVTIPLFIVGTFAYREVCWDVKKESGSSYFKLADYVIQDKLNSFSSIKFNDVSINIDIDKIHFVTETLYRDCKKNGSLVKAISDNLNISDSVVDGILNKTIPRIREIIDNFNISKLDLFSNENQIKINETALRLSALDIPILNISLPIVLPSVEDIQALMNLALPDIIDPTKRAELERLIAVNITEIYEIANKELSLSNELNSMIIGVKRITDMLIDVLVQIPLAFDQIKNTDISGNLLTTFERHIKETFWKFYNYLIEKLNQTAKCREVYEAVDAVVYGVCDLVVDPLNSFWFCLGISIVLFIPSFTIGLWMSGLVAKKEKNINFELNNMSHNFK